MVVFVNKAKMVEDSHEIQIIVSGLYSFILRKFLNERTDGSVKDYSQIG